MLQYLKQGEFSSYNLCSAIKTVCVVSHMILVAYFCHGSRFVVALDIELSPTSVATSLVVRGLFLTRLPISTALSLNVSVLGGVPTLRSCTTGGYSTFESAFRYVI